MGKISNITFRKWLTQKPKFDCWCIVITANKIRKQWEYSIFTVQRVDFEDKWYWGLIDGNGDEWGDIEDLKAQKYYVIEAL